MSRNAVFAVLLDCRFHLLQAFYPARDLWFPKILAAYQPLFSTHVAVGTKLPFVFTVRRLPRMGTPGI